MATSRAPADDETSISEISIAPDGRVYVFGASHEVLELLTALNDRDAALRQRIEHLRAAGLHTGGPADQNCNAARTGCAAALDSVEGGKRR